MKINIKKIFVLLILLQIGLNQSLQSQNEAVFTYKNALKINPGNLGNSEFRLNYERYFGDRKSSIMISPSFYLKESEREKISGYQFQTSYRYFLSHLNKTNGNSFLGLYNLGFYAGVYGQWLSYEEHYDMEWYNPKTNMQERHEFEKTGTAIEGGALLGLQIDITPRLIADFYLGGGIRKSNIDDSIEDNPDFSSYYESPGVFDVDFTGVKPVVGFQLGFTF
jgi:hypothetical protein